MSVASSPPPARPGLLIRAIRGSAWLALGYGASQAARLGANLILTRLLFPEAFGLMALVTVIVVGLNMFSDVGIGPAISRSPRGDDPDFLNTAWTFQVIRGFALWAAAAALAWPVAAFYEAPALSYLLPAAGAALAIAGFEPTRIETAHRHLMVGRVTLLELTGQLIGIVAMIALAAATGSVAALVAGNLVGAAAKLALTHLCLPGMRNRFRLEPAAATELLGFGKWIFLSTICGFLTSQGDRAILGKFLTMAMLGIYNIGFFLASFPMLLGYAVTGRVLIPIYREAAEGARAENAAKLRKMRFALTGGLLALIGVMAAIGPALVGLLYDARYAAAGGVVVAIACAQIPQVIGMSYPQAALAAGDSKRFFWLTAAQATLQIGLLLTGAILGGLVGALIGMGLAGLLMHPPIVWLARRHGAWDARHDLIYAGLGIAIAALALALNGPAVMALI